MRATNKKALFIRAFKKSFLYLAEFFWYGADSYYYIPFARFHEVLEYKLINIDRYFKIIAIPRGFGKSKIVSVLYTIWSTIIGKDMKDKKTGKIETARRSYVLLVSKSQKKSKQNLRDIKNLIETPKFRSVFPFDDDLWREDAIKINLKDRNGKTIHTILIEAVGSGQQILGFSEGASRPDLIIFDDLEDTESVLNKERVDKLEKWINSEVLPGRSKNDKFGRPAEVILIGTPFDADCMLSRAMLKRWRKNVAIITFPALVETEQQSLELGIPIDQSIWEELHPTHTRDGIIGLHEEREDYNRKGMIADFRMQYQMDANADKKLSFEHDKFVFISKRDVQKALPGSRVVVIFDMAYTQKTSSDYVGVSIAAHYPKSIMHIIHGSQYRWTMNQCWEFCVDCEIKYGEVIQGFYAESLQVSLIQQIFHENNVKHGRGIQIVPIKEKTHMRKENRIQRLIPFHETGRIQIVEDDCYALVGQMRSFSGTRVGSGHDDALDACAYQVDFAERSIAPDPEGPKVLAWNEVDASEYFKMKNKVHQINPFEA